MQASTSSDYNYLSAVCADLSNVENCIKKLCIDYAHSVESLPCRKIYIHAEISVGATMSLQFVLVAFSLVGGSTCMDFFRSREENIHLIHTHL